MTRYRWTPEKECVWCAGRGEHNPFRPELRTELRWFVQEMEWKLQANDHKGGWRECHPFALFERLQEEVEEIRAQLNADPDDIAKLVAECADVANFAMMIADVIRRVKGGWREQITSVERDAAKGGM